MKSAGHAGIESGRIFSPAKPDLSQGLQAVINKEPVAVIGLVDANKLAGFDIRQPVFYADLYWDKLVKINSKNRIEYREVPRFPSVNRDLAIVVNKSFPYESVENATRLAGVKKLRSISLFDIFESEKLGADKKSMAVSFTFLDEGEDPYRQRDRRHDEQDHRYI